MKRNIIKKITLNNKAMKKKAGVKRDGIYFVMKGEKVKQV
jgi:hypothetical protein